MTGLTRITLDDVEIPARGRGFHVVLEEGVVVAISRDRSPAAAARAYAGRGGAVVPALYDHHHHITASVARQWSCDIAPCRDGQEALALMLQAMPRAGVLRVVGYDEARHGPWTRGRLDAATAGPVKVQHRSGHMWVMNTAALARLPGGTHRPADGRFHDEDPRLDDPARCWTRLRAGIAGHVARLQGMGVAGCNDMTAHLSADDWQRISGALPRDFTALAFGDPDKGLARSKLVVAEHDLPTLDALQAMALRLAGRAQVAVHAVTYEALVLALVGLAALGDRLRIEHAFLADAEMTALARAAGVGIGVQPGFIRTQGDRLLRELDRSALADYQPLRRLHAAGLRLYGGTDAPFAPGDPWVAMQAAVTRRTKGGQLLNAAQALHPNQAFALFTRAGLHGEVTPPDLRPGQRDGVVLLDRPWAAACLDFTRVRVVAGIYPTEKSRDLL